MNTGLRALASIVSLTLFIATANAQDANDDEADAAVDQQTTRQAQAVSRSVYEVIEKAQSLVEAEDFDAAIKLLPAQQR